MIADPDSPPKSYKPSVSPRHRMDILVVVSVTLISLIFSVYLDLFEHIIEFTVAHEDFEIDEFIPAFFILILSLIWYSRRRRHDLEQSIIILTELKESLADHQKNLEHKISERTSALKQTNDDLQTEIERRKSAEKKIIHSEKLKSAVELAGAICHELNQPLQSISGYTELILMDPPDDPGLVDRIKKIKSQIDTMNEITKKLVSITSYETKQYPGNTNILDLQRSSGKKP